MIDQNRFVGKSDSEILQMGLGIAEALEKEVGKVVYGQEMKDLIDFLILAVFADGHVLVRSNIGLGKTLTCEAIARAIGGQFKKRQFRPDMLPSEISGFEIYNEEKRRFEIHHGPLYKANVFLADEINRGTPKGQAALLEAMEERHLTIAKEVFPLEEVFLVLATRNPIEHEGTYDLPEAQLDRFFGQPGIGSFSEETGLLILSDPDFWRSSQIRLARVQSVTNPSEIVTLRDMIFKNMHVEPRVNHYIWSLVSATWKHPAVEYGSSPRGAINLKKAAIVSAFREKQKYVTYEHVRRFAVDILAHRIFMKREYRNVSERKYTPASIIEEIVGNVKYD